MTPCPLDADRLLACAEAATGLDDWADPTFADRFSLAVDHLRAADLEPVHERMAAANCLRVLTDRLRFFRDHDQHGLAAEVIERPMFVTGEPRSGTTLLHALLSVDAASRSLRFWEVMFPSPPPGRADADDARRAAADDEWRQINAHLPEWLVCHPYNDMLGDGLPECERTWAIDFRALSPTAWWRVPISLGPGALPQDPVEQYRIHRMMLQAIQHGRSRRTWVLKGFHAGRLQWLFGAYPDARLLYIHRDPVPVIASRVRMTVMLYEALTGTRDSGAHAQRHLAAARAGFHATLTNPLLHDPRVLHVRYQDFIGDRIGTIRRFYEFSDRTLSFEAAGAMEHYLATNRGDRYGKFAYSIDAIGDVEQLNEEFRPYRERFGVDLETAS
jgi:hypothetical protein